MSPIDLLRLGLSNALASAALAVVVAGLTLPLRRRRPALVHALWLLVLLKLVTPPVWNVPVQWAVREATPPHVDAPVARDVDEVEYVLVDELPAPVAPPALAPDPVNWSRVAAGTAWAGGSLACLLLIVTRSVRFHRLLRHATPAPPEVGRRVRAVAADVGVAQPPAAWLVPGAVCPMLYAAFGRPRLLLPKGLWDRLDDEARDTLIAHELAHLRRRDHWVRLVEVAATVLYWWSPVLWWARRELREAEEQCCDAWVVWSMPAAVRDYMRAILEAVEYVSEPKPGGATQAPGPSPFAPAAVPALASGMGEFRRLERRLWMIRRSDSPHRLSRPAFVAVLLGAAVLPLAPTLAGPEDPGANVEGREIVITPSAPHAENISSDGREEDRTGLRLDVREPVRVEKEVVIARDGRSLTVTGDEVAFTDSDDLAPASVIVDPRTGNRIEVRGKSLRLVGGSELEQARAAVERARANLAVAQKRLEMLETSVGGADDRTAKSADNVKTKLGIIASRSKPEAREKGVTLKGELKGDAKGAATKGADADPEPRIRQLEEKLEKIDALLSEIRDQRKPEGNLRNELKAEPSQGLQAN